ncbi:hypothetical protein EPA93_16030 [Ktedonosporobacter rubrisoli]|uniref:HAD family hydrolase n=1 Tax=Ktedonosporobacter rubrisoli TaxID=2509675 RepID=A0A4P6JPU6_KTERU|nr:hypothetical protein [Ktedonosporobacter rubrisoli]QBD77418.1 hypothetical protein EPA93_16030 [Ktedonosporobacter rubrisoli]
MRTTKMHIFVDIDGTIARRNPQHTMRLLNVALKLSLPPEQLATLSWEDFLQLPALIEKIGAEGERKRQKFLSSLNLEPSILREHIPIEGSQHALLMLAQAGHTMSYATARLVLLEPHAPASMRAKYAAINERIQTSTKQWLSHYHYPFPHRVHFSGHGASKLPVIASWLHNHPQEQAILIDDRPELFAQGWSALSADAQTVLGEQERFVLVGYNVKMLEEGQLRRYPFRSVICSSWNHFADLIQEEGVLSHGRSTTHPAAQPTRSPE